MSRPCETTHACTHACPWSHTSQCVMHLIPTGSAAAHLGQSQWEGLHSYYHPHPVPPCIISQGRLCFHPAEDHELQEFYALTDDDCPGL